jgi:Skp family chaperone for outer membrane proteins
MSEFQFYDFRSIDRPLTDSERREVSSWSSRSNASSHRATFNYSYSSFGKDPLDCVAKYFDAMFYTANWGTRHLIFRFPKKMVDYKALAAFDIDASDATGYETGIAISSRGDYALLEFQFCEDEYSGWIDEADDTLSGLLSLREDILQGDYRSLFIFWLDMANRLALDTMDEDNFDDEDEDEEGRSPLRVPPIPANLKQSNPALKALIDLYELNEDLIAAAATFSSEPPKSAPFDLQTALNQLSEKDKNDWLTRLFEGEIRLDKMFKKHLESLQPKTKAEQVKSKTVSFSDITALLGGKQAERLENEAIDKANAHIKKMNELSKKEAEMWKTVYFNLDRKTSSAYDIASDTLKDLYDVAVFVDRKNLFLEKFYDIEDRYGRSRTFLERLKKLKLPVRRL